MKIVDNIIREKYSERGGGCELDLTEYGYEDELMSAYQNYLGGGMRGAVANSCTIEDWQLDDRLVQIASSLRDYYESRLRQFDLVDEYNRSTEGRLVSYPGL